MSRLQPPYCGVSRRQMLAGSAALLAAPRWGVGLLSAEDTPPSKRLRVLAYNVYECTGWPKDRVFGKKATQLGQMPARFAQELALYEPDLIVLSESPREEVTQQIAKQLGLHHARFLSGGKWPGTLLSRYEIRDAVTAPVAAELRSPELFTRHWGRASVILPNGEMLRVHSAHLHPSDSKLRVREIEAMLASMKDDLRAGLSTLVLGDLNHTPAPPEHPLWLKAGFVDAFQKLGEGSGTTFMADDLKRRIDYVLASGPIAQRLTAVRPLFEGAFRLNVEDPQAFALSDHLPILADFAWN